MFLILFLNLPSLLKVLQRQRCFLKLNVTFKFMLIVWYLENTDKYKKTIKLCINMFLYKKYQLSKSCLIPKDISW